MLKHTLHISQPSYLHLRNKQLVIRNKETEDEATVPIEDIATLILAEKQITLSSSVLSACVQAQVSVISCDDKYMPIGMFLLLDGHSEHQSILSAQLSATKPLTKQLWKSVIEHKVANQARLLERLGLPSKRLFHLARQVKSDDTTGVEAQSAKYYWTQYFGDINKHHGIKDPTYRKREGYPPNNWLNYGYTLLRSMVSRALTGSGLLPTLGIHHHNKYNAYCLSDDIMEPYRPMVDQLVHELAMQHELSTDIPMVIKKPLLQLATQDCLLENKKYTLYTAIERTTASLAQSFIQSKNQILYPQIL